MSEEWINKIRIGDILLTKAGNPRTVLNVRKNPKGRSIIVTLKKLQKNPVYPNLNTSYTSSDLRHMGYVFSGVRVKNHSSQQSQTKRGGV